MKSFQVPILSMLLLGLCLLSGLDMRPAHADFVFGEPMNLGAPVNSSLGDMFPVLSPDGLELYFTSDRSGGHGSTDIWVAKRASVQDPWGPPTNLGPNVNTSAWEAAFSMSADGLTLYFDSGGPSGRCYQTTRASSDAPWESRVDLGPSLGPGSGGAVISSDGLEIYFVASWPGGYGGWDIWVSTRAAPSDPWGTPVNLGPTVNTPYVDATTWISPDGLTLLLTSDRPGGFGSYDVWMLTRPSKASAWGPPRNLGSSINTIYAEEIISISPDGQWCYIDDFGGPHPGGLGWEDISQVPIIRFVDFNGDGNVDGKEVLCMAAHWGTDDPMCDIGPMPWGDGIVDLQDLTVLAEYIGKEVSDSTLMAHWPLDEMEGSTAHEKINQRDDMIVGGALWQPTGGQVDGALELDGVDDCIISSLALDPSQGPFSVLAWVKGGSPDQAIISQPAAANWLMADDAGELMTDLKGSDLDSAPLQSQTIVTDGQWHRVALSWDGSFRVLYVDGVVAAEDSQDDLAGSSNSLFIGVGKDYRAGTFWSGLIDDVRIYSRTVRP